MLTKTREVGQVQDRVPIHFSSASTGPGFVGRIALVRLSGKKVPISARSRLRAEGALKLWPVFLLALACGGVGA